MQLPFEVDLQNKVAVVTGGGGVLCRGFAHTLAACGAKVAVLDINEEAAKSTADSINAGGGTAKAYKADVLNGEAMTQVAEAVKSELGPCNILLNGAGGNNPKATTDKETYEKGDIDADVKTFFDLDKQSVDFVFGLNFMGTLVPTQAFAKQMLENGGVIVNVSSMNAFTPLTKIPAYSAAKAAVSNFTQWLAVHFAGTGIRVNALAPGFFVTNQNKDMLFGPDGSPTPRTNKILAATPMDRFGKPEELDGALLFLVSEKASSFVTGIVMPIDGGFSAYSGV